MEDILIPLAGMVTALILLTPLVRAFARLLERKTRAASEVGKLDSLREDLEVLQDRLDAIERSEDRIAELEERLEFAERLLAQRPEAPQIGDRK